MDQRRPPDEGADAGEPHHRQERPESRSSAGRHEPRPDAFAGSVTQLTAPAQDPYEVTTSRVREIEASGWSASGEQARWYAAVTDVLRDYLEAAHGLPASRRTSSELISLLPPALLPAGLRARLTRLLVDSDEVKFARARPEAEAARGAVRSARLLLDAWHAAPVSPNAAPHLSAAWGSPRPQAG